MNRMLSCAVAVLAFATVAVAGEPVAPIKLAPIWTVQVDAVEKTVASKFEINWAKYTAMRRTICRENGVDVPPSWVIENGAGHYLTLRPLQKFAELDEPSKIPPDVQKQLDQKLGTLDAEIRPVIQSHVDQIWRLVDDATWIPGPLPQLVPQPEYIRVRTSRPIPGKEQEYAEAIRKFRDALAKAKYPIGMLAFYSEYGEGNYLFLLYAPSKTIADTAKPLGEALAAVLGADGTKAVNDALAASSTRKADNPGRARPELSAAEPSVGWMGLPLSK